MERHRVDRASSDRERLAEISRDQSRLAKIAYASGDSEVDEARRESAAEVHPNCDNVARACAQLPSHYFLPTPMRIPAAATKVAPAASSRNTAGVSALNKSTCRKERFGLAAAAGEMRCESPPHPAACRHGAVRPRSQVREVHSACKLTPILMSN